MTKQEAIRLLRTEHLGDSEAMELAKQMGAAALEQLHTHFITPKCGNCGRHILGIEIVTVPELSHNNLRLTSKFDPAHCPTCHALFIKAELNHEEQTCVLIGLKEEPKT